MKNTLSRMPDWRLEMNAGALGWLLIVGWMVLLAFALPASAQTALPSTAIRQACGADVHSLCSGVIPGGGRIKQCMLKKLDQVSPGCRKALAAAAPTQIKDQK